MRGVEPDDLAVTVAVFVSDGSSVINENQCLVEGGIAGVYVTPH